MPKRQPTEPVDLTDFHAPLPQGMVFHLTGMENHPMMSTSMANVDTGKKPVHLDWHPADIKAALEKRGWSLRRLSFAHRYAAQSLQAALRRPWPAAERIIAGAIGVQPQRIWPSRYRRDGTPKSGRGERGIGRYKRKGSTAGRISNVDAGGSA